MALAAIPGDVRFIRRSPDAHPSNPMGLLERLVAVLGNRGNADIFARSVTAKGVEHRSATNSQILASRRLPAPGQPSIKN